MSFKHDFEWSKQKYIEKWNELWRNQKSDITFKKSGIWLINESTIDLGTWYDSIVRYSNFKGNNMGIFPAIGSNVDNIKESLKKKYISGLEMKECVVKNDHFHVKSIDAANNLFESSDYTLNIDESLLNDSCWDNTTITNITNNSVSAVKEHFYDIKSITVKCEGKFTDNISNALLLLSSIQWPMRSKYLINSFPFDIIVGYQEDLAWILEALLFINIIFRKTSGKGVSAFKNILIVPSSASQKDYIFSNQKFANKLWNLSKFILQLQKTILSTNIGFDIDRKMEIKEAAFSKDDTEYIRYTKEFILSLKEECVERPPNLPEIIIIQSQKVVLNKWHTKKSGESNVDEEKIRKCRGYMNKLTEQTVDVLLPKILPLLQPSIINDIISLIFQKISWDKHFHFIYSQMCSEVQKKCPSFIDKFMKKCTEFIKTSNESERHNKISVIMFLAKLLNEDLLNLYSQSKNSMLEIINYLLTNNEIELICNLYKNLNNNNLKYKNSDIMHILKEYSENKENPGRIRFLCIDTIEYIENNYKPDIIEKCSKDIINKEKEVIEEQESDQKVTGIPTYITFLLKWMINSLKETNNCIDQVMSHHNISETFSIIEKYFFNDFSDIYLESVKPYLFQHHYRLYRQEIYVTMYKLYFKSLEMAMPFYPIVVEEIYQKFKMDGLTIEDKHDFGTKEILNSFHPINNILPPKLTISKIEIEEFDSVREIIDILRGKMSLNSKKDKYNVSITCKTNWIYLQCVKFYDFIHILTDCVDLSITDMTTNSSTKNSNEAISSNINYDLYLEKIQLQNKKLYDKTRNKKGNRSSVNQEEKTRKHSGRYSQYQKKSEGKNYRFKNDLSKENGKESYKSKNASRTNKKTEDRGKWQKNASRQKYAKKYNNE